MNGYLTLEQLEDRVLLSDGIVPLVFFAADNGVDGEELWRTDGTANGTYLVKDIRPGIDTSNLGYLEGLGPNVLFAANDGQGTGTELWRSNGLESGTYPVKDIILGEGSSDPAFLTKSGSVIYFTISDLGQGKINHQLWKTDGTAAGTTQVPVDAGLNLTDIGSLTDVNGTLYFTARDVAFGNELFKTTGATISLVKNIRPGMQSSDPVYLTNVNGTLFFVADDGMTGLELWKSNGTAAGTVAIDFVAIPGVGLNPAVLEAVGGTVFFRATTAADGAELWKSNGTVAGTQIVKNIRPMGDGSNPQSLTNVGGTLFFVVDEGINPTELWKSNGTAASTERVKDTDSLPQNLTNGNGTLFFSASSGGEDSLWKSDGTEMGTGVIGALGLAPQGLTPGWGTGIYFSGNDEDNGREIWKSDGTGPGTGLIRNINDGSDDSSPNDFTLVLTAGGGGGSSLALPGGTPFLSWAILPETNTLVAQDASLGPNKTNTAILLSHGEDVDFVDLDFVLLFGGVSEASEEDSESLSDEIFAPIEQESSLETIE